MIPDQHPPLVRALDVVMVAVTADGARDLEVVRIALPASALDVVILLCGRRARPLRQRVGVGRSEDVVQRMLASDVSHLSMISQYDLPSGSWSSMLTR